MTPFDAAVFVVKTVGWLVAFLLGLWFLAIIVSSVFDGWSDITSEVKTAYKVEWDGRPVIKMRNAYALGGFVVVVAVAMYLIHVFNP